MTSHASFCKSKRAARKIGQNPCLFFQWAEDCSRWSTRPSEQHSCDQAHANCSHLTHCEDCDLDCTTFFSPESQRKSGADDNDPGCCCKTQKHDEICIQSCGYSCMIAVYLSLYIYIFVNVYVSFTYTFIYTFLFHAVFSRLEKQERTVET